MPSQQVIEKLEDLRKELDKASTAVNHIKEAGEAAKTAADILESIPNLLIDIKELEEKYHEELLKYYKGKIDALAEQLHNLLKELNGKLEQLNQLIVETKKLEETISDYYTEIKKIKFPERLDKIDNQISAINIGIANIQTVLLDMQSKVELVQTTINSLNQKVDRRFSDLENKIATANTLLKKDIKANRIITIIIGVIVIIGIALILFFDHKLSLLI